MKDSTFLDVNCFFAAIADCGGRENHLSDMTYAMCSGNVLFKSFFLDFIFPAEKIEGSEVELSREYNYGDSRPDFLIENRKDRKLYIIEVKIGDMRQHFLQYLKLLPDLYRMRGWTVPEGDLRRFIGYIANYKITTSNVPESDGFENIYTWKQLYDELKRKSLGEDGSIHGFAEYCRTVCGFIDVGAYDFCMSDFKVVKEQFHWLDLVIERSRDLGIERYEGYQQRSCSEGWKIGRFFEVKGFTQESSAWGWIGVYMVEDEEQVVVEFDDCEQWGKAVCDALGRGFSAGQTIEYSESDKKLYFYFNGSKEMSLEMLNDYLRSVIRRVRGDMEAFEVEKYAKRPQREWLALRNFPELLNGKLMGSWLCAIDGRDYRITLSKNECSVYQYPKDVEQKYCVLYFDLSVAEETGVAYQQSGWVGIYYGEDNPVVSMAIDDAELAEKAMARSDELRKHYNKKRFEFVLEPNEYTVLGICDAVRGEIKELLSAVII